MKNTNCTMSEKSLTNLQTERGKQNKIKLNCRKEKIWKNSCQTPRVLNTISSLNCFAFEWKCTNWLNCCIIWKSLSFVRALVLSVPKPHLTSSAVEIKIKQGEMTTTKTQTTASPRVNVNTNCIKIAIKYPTGVLVSNGNLKANSEDWLRLQKNRRK